MWNSARESLDGILELLKNKNITLNKRQDAVAQLANDLTVCAEGCVSKIEEVYLNLQLELLSNDEFFQKQKEQLIGQFIIDFVRDNKKSWHSVMDVHFVNAYYNAIADYFGLVPRHHEQTVMVTRIPEQAIKKCLQFIKTSINPKYFVSQLTTQLISEIEDVLIPFKQQQKISLDLFQDEIAMRAIDAILTRANKRYHSSLTLHQFLVDTSDDNSSYEIVKDNRMLQLIIVNGLQIQQILEANQPVLVAKHSTGEVYSLFDQWFWIQTADGEKTVLHATQLEKLITAFKKRRAHTKLISPLTTELISQATVQQLGKLPLSFFSNGSNFLSLAEKLGTEDLAKYLTRWDLVNFTVTFSNQYDLYHFINKLPKIALLIKKIDFFNEENQRCSFNKTLATPFFIDLMLPDDSRNFSFSETRFQVLLKAGADINVKNSLGRSLLSYAAEGFSSLVEKLLLLNVDVNSQDKKGNTPLMHAVYKNQEQIVEKLINCKNINLSVENIQGTTALDLAKRAGGNLLILIQNALLDNGIKNIHNNPDPVGTIVELCDKLGDQVVADYFSKHFLSTDSTLTNLKIILPTEHTLFYSFSNYPNTFSILKPKIIINSLDHPILFNTEMVNKFWLRFIETGRYTQRDPEGHQYSEILKSLISLGADINQGDSDGRTLLIKAAISGNLETVTLLINQSTININIVDKNQQNALMLAARENQGEVVKQLLMHPEVNLKQVDINGNNAYLLTPKSNEALRDLIASHSKKPEIEDTFWMVAPEDAEEAFEIISAKVFAKPGNLRQGYNAFNENEVFGFVVVNQAEDVVLGLDPNPIHFN